MDQELREYLDKQFKFVDERFNSLEAGVRHTNVVVEDLRGQIQLVAEGVAAVNNRVDRLESRMDEEFKEVRATICSLYTPLDRRVTSLEARVEELESA